MHATLVLLTAVLAAEPAPTLTLPQALEEAESQNFDLRQARERLAQARLQWRKVLAGYLPTVTAGGSYTRNQSEATLSLPNGYWLRDLSGVPGFDPATVNGPVSPDVPGQPSTTVLMPSGFDSITVQKQDQLGAQFQLQQALLVPSLWPAFGLADLGGEVAQASVEAARQEVLFGVAQLYYLAAGQKEALAVRREFLESALVTERQARMRYEAGTAPKLDLLLAQTERSAAEQELALAGQAYATARIALATLLDHAGDFEVVVPVPVSVEEPGLAQEDGRERPDVVAARLSRTLAEKSHDATWYRYLPNVVATATYQLSNVSGFTNETGQWAIGVGASWTLWDGGAREVELEETASKAREAGVALAGAERRARDEVRTAAFELESARANVLKSAEQVRLAREAMLLADTSYAAGTSTQVEVSKARSQLKGAELAALLERLKVEVSAMKLLKAAGKFSRR